MSDLKKIKIHWNGFLGFCCESYPDEACAMLYAKLPFSQLQEWFVFPIKNVHNSPQNGWVPDTGELTLIKKKADKLGLVKIGNVHSHPLPPIKDHQELTNDGDLSDMWERYTESSDVDLSFAKKFNDIIRGILVVDELGVYAYGWHDKFGKKIKLYLIEELQEGGYGLPPTAKS